MLGSYFAGRRSLVHVRPIKKFANRSPSSFVANNFVKLVAQLIQLAVQRRPGFSEFVSIREQLLRHREAGYDGGSYVLLFRMSLAERTHLAVKVVGDVLGEILVVLGDAESILTFQDSDTDRLFQRIFDLTGHFSRSFVIEILVDRSDETPDFVPEISSIPVHVEPRLRLYFLDHALQLPDTLGHAHVLGAKPDYLVRRGLNTRTKPLQ